ncbi:hypothetical protein [Hymenobacter sp. BT559]|uniref:hypothetical protein n=1 Tax=Hymenobacter sp. BT559 TaxID=2795729 RepID=UPI0018ECC6AF|nr:hypothetical protein [Hymenobacter sp. BT559]MBJ6141757.1 hypothetical protein [Hymenobacter sp. BT559]
MRVIFQWPTTHKAAQHYCLLPLRIRAYLDKKAAALIITMEEGNPTLAIPALS